MSIVVDPEESTVEDSTKIEEGLREVPQEETVESELQEAQEESKEFRGMDFETLTNSYQHLERKLSEQGQEVGELRKRSDDLILKQTPQVEEEDFFENPQRAVNQAIEGNDRLRSIEEKAAAMELMTAKSELTRRHPDYQKVDESPEFSKFINSSKLRLRAYTEASKSMDVDVADELMSMFKESIKTQEVKSQELDGERKETLKSVKSDSGSTGGTTTKKIFRRADLMKLQTQDPNRYDEMQDEILSAYAEGRVR